MKPLEILLLLPKWAKAKPDAIVDSPAFSLQGRMGEETVTVVPAPVAPAASESLVLSVSFGDEPHTLLIARSPRFPELDRIWDTMSDVPEPILLALVERECGPMFQMLENAVRRQLKLAGIAAAAGSADAEGKASGCMALQISGDPGIVFALTRSATVVSAFGALRNLDLSHESVRSQTLPSEVEYAAFAMPDEDVASLAVGDAVLVPEIGSVEPKLVVDRRFVADGGGVSQYAEDSFVHIRAAESGSITFGELFDATTSPVGRPAAENGAQLRLFLNGTSVARGRLDRIADQVAFIVEAMGA